MTKREEERLAELLAKKQAEEAKERAFWSEVKRRKVEVVRYLKKLERLDQKPQPASVSHVTEAEPDYAHVKHE